MLELLNALNREDVLQREHQLRFLSNKMSVFDNTVKEDLLSKNVFVGRQWLFDDVKNWLSDPAEKNFVIYGVPGAGKSAFAANLALNFPEVFASVFLKWNSHTSREVDSFIRLLAYKLALTLEGYRENLCHIYEDESSIKNLTGQDLFETIILNPLDKFVTGNHETGMIIFDGLDEASKSVITLLMNNLNSFPHWIKILFTSRNDINISSRLNEYKQITIEGSEENNLNDIKTYLSNCLNLSESSDKIIEIANKTEGSFLYAKAFCDSVKYGRMTLEHVSDLPYGLNSFYRGFFERIFDEVPIDSVRTFLEILCVDDDVPEEILTECLGIDAYDLCDLRLKLKSLVISTEAHFDAFNLPFGDILPNNLKIFRFAHQSMKEWLTNQELATEFYIKASNGYKALADHYEDQTKQLEDEDDNKYIDFIINLSKKLDDPEGAEDPYLPFRNDTLKKYQNDRYIKWLILGKEYDKAEKSLLDSFASRNFGTSPDCLPLISLWKWADLFPKTKSVSKLVEKLKDLLRLSIEYIKNTPQDIPIYWRDTIRCFIILSEIMDSGRFAPVFFEAIEQFPLDLLITRGKEDYYSDAPLRTIAQNVAICLDKLNANGTSLPDDVRERCDIMISLQGTAD